MSFRFAVGGISHETNTYCKHKTEIEEFKIWRGQQIIDNSSGVRSFIGGMMDAAEELGATLVPVFYTRAQPSGTISRAAYDSMLAELLDGIKQAMPLDAVALALHGAGVVEGIDDLEAHLCHSVRDIVGPAVKIVAVFDLHGNITQCMADALDMCLGVHYYPHVDGYERGHEAVMSIPRLLSGEWKPVTHVEHVPMLIASSPTRLHPARTVNELCWEIEKREDILDCTFFHGFPYTDIPHVGLMVSATANGNVENARRAAQEVAKWIWDHRQEFVRETFSPDEAIEKALSVSGGPVVINDTADNPGGGTPGDATHVLRAMIEHDLKDACFGFIYDPEVAKQCHEAGVGKRIRVSLGGKYDDFHGAPLDLLVYVKCLTDGRFIQQTPMGRGSRVDLGRMARIVTGGIDILVSSVRTQTLDPEVFLLHGIDVTRYKIVALKSSTHFRAGFEPIAKQIIAADSPGLTTLNVSHFPRERTKRPIWPIDQDARYPIS